MNSTANASGIPRLLTAQQVDRALGVRSGTTSRLNKLGIIEAVPLPGKSRKYTAEAVRRALGIDPMGGGDVA